MEYDATTSNPPKSTTNECVVGLEDLIGRLKRELDYNGKEGRRLSFTYICGMGGSGKTTVARLLFDDDLIRSNFQFKAWIRASDKRTTQELLQCITDSLKTEHTGKELTQQDEMTERDSRQQIGGYLAQYPNYLVVLDDLFPIDNWDSWMEEAFPDTKNHSRIIITTRKKPLVRRSRMVRMHIEELSLLSPADSWDLFCKKTSKGGGGGFMSCSPSSELLARDMVERCGGLPLAIVVLAHLLSKTPPGDWPLVEEHLWQKLKKESPDEISELLTPTYNNLPQALQQCFLYTAMFPEGYEFDLQKLLQLYMADRFAPLPREIMAVQFDRSDLDELIDWNLIQVTGKLWEEPVKCKVVHGLVHHLSIEKAQEVSFFDIFAPQKGHSISLHPRSRHAIHGYLQDFISLPFQKNEENNSQLGTLLFFKPQREYFIEVNELASRCMIFQRLRVLDLNGINFRSNEKHLHEMLGILIYLKFLGLGNTFIRKLPPSIGNLKLLQTLEVHGKYSCALPPEMSKLTALRYLRGHFRGPLYLQGLTNLHTLGAVDVEQMSRLDGSQLRNLRELTLCHGTKGQPLSLESMPFLPNLKSLILISSTFDDYMLHGLLLELARIHRLWLHGPIRIFPLIYYRFKSLRSLILSESEFTNDPLQILSETMPNLESLELINCYQGKMMFCYGGFPSLRVLRLTEFYELEKLEVRAGGMPRIEGLAIHECSDKLKLLPPQKFEKIPHLPQSETGSYLRDILVGQSHKLEDET